MYLCDCGRVVFQTKILLCIWCDRKKNSRKRTKIDKYNAIGDIMQMKEKLSEQGIETESSQMSIKERVQ